MFKFCCCGRFNKKDKVSYKSEYQLLLLGTDESGKLNIIEKLASLQNQFTHHNRINRIPQIKCHIRDSMINILYAFNKFSSFIKLEHPENQWRVTYILTTAEKVDFDYPSEFFESVAILWTDATVKLYFKRSEQHQFMDSTKHFLDRVNQIKEADYIPTDQDMIHSRFFQSNVYEMTFDFASIHYRLFEVDLLREERRKWIHCFSDIDAIIFVVDCSNFSLESIGNNSHTDLFESIEKFRMTMVNKWLRTKPIILLLNKQDRLQKKIKNGFHVEDYFRACYGGLVPLTKPIEIDFDEDREKYLIRDQFLRISTSYGMGNHRCYPHFICDTDMATLRLIFDDCHDIKINSRL